MGPAVPPDIDLPGDGPAVLTAADTPARQNDDDHHQRNEARVSTAAAAAALSGRDEDSKTSALFTAAARGNLSSVRLVLEHG